MEKKIYARFHKPTRISSNFYKIFVKYLPILRSAMSKAVIIMARHADVLFKLILFYPEKKFVLFTIETSMCTGVLCTSVRAKINKKYLRAVVCLSVRCT